MSGTLPRGGLSGCSMLCHVEVYPTVWPVLLLVIVTQQLLVVDTFSCIRWIYFQHTLVEHLDLHSVVIRAVGFFDACTTVAQSHDVYCRVACWGNLPNFLYRDAIVYQPRHFWYDLWPKLSCFHLLVALFLDGIFGNHCCCHAVTAYWCWWLWFTHFL